MSSVEYNIPTYNEYPILTDIHPLILNDYTDDMISVKNIILVLQTPPNGYAYCSNYISAGPQTHFALYKIIPNNKLELIYDALLIVYDGCSAYLIDKNMKQVLKNNKLNSLEIDNIMKNKYNYITPLNTPLNTH